MADATKELQIVLTAKDEASAQIEGFKGSLNGLSAAAAGLGLGIVAKDIAGMGLSAIDSAMKFQSSMELIRTQAGASQQEVDKMSQSVLALSGKVATTPEELATALYHVESAGYRGAQALDILKTAAEGAKVGQADLESVTNALTATVVSGIGGVKGMDQAMGVLNATVGAGNMRMQDLTDSLASGILPAAKTFGLTIQDVGAALATLTDNGVPAIDAATRLRMTFSLLGAPTKQATDELASIGLTQLQLANDMRGPNGLVTALQDLKTHLTQVQPVTEEVVKGTAKHGQALVDLQNHIKDTTAHLKILQEEHVKSGVATDKHNLSIQTAQQQLQKYQSELAGSAGQIKQVGGAALTAAEQADLLSRAFGGGRSSSAILTLLDQLDRVKTKYQDISGGAGTFNQDVATTAQTAAYQMAQWNANLQEFAITVGDTVLPVLNKFLTVLNQHHEVFIILAAVLAGVFTVALIGATAAAIAFLVPLITATVAIGALTAPIWLVALAIGGLVAGLVLATHAFLDHQAQVKGFLTTMQAGLIGFFNDAKKLISEVGQQFSNFGTGLRSVEKSVDDFINGAPTRLKTFFEKDLPYALGYVIGYLSVKIPADLKTFGNNMNSEVSSWPGRLQTHWNQMIANANSAINQFSLAFYNGVNRTWNYIASNVSIWPGNIQKFLASIPGDMEKLLTDLLNVATRKLSDIWNSIVSFKDKVVGAFNDIKNAIEGAINAFERGLAAGISSASNVQKRASGGYASGLTLVGEQGPELVSLPPGSYVHNNSETQQMLGNSNQVTINFNGDMVLDAESRVSELANKIIEVLGRQNLLAQKGLAI